jgi:hypothetical protein
MTHTHLKFQVSHLQSLILKLFTFEKGKQSKTDPAAYLVVVCGGGEGGLQTQVEAEGNRHCGREQQLHNAV